MTVLYRLTFMVFGLGLSACSMMEFDRSRESGYARSDEYSSSVEDYYQQKRINEVQQIKQELGLSEVGEPNEMQQQAIRTRMLLKHLEERIPNDLERRQYYSLKPYFESDRQRIEYLRIPSRAGREQYAVKLGVGIQTKIDPQTQALIDASDISKGMSREAVKLSWGEPDAVEVAGNAFHGNERWIYKKLMSTEDGYRQETRLIYFESGKVTGWETE